MFEKNKNTNPNYTIQYRSISDEDGISFELQADNEDTTEVAKESIEENFSPLQKQDEDLKSLTADYGSPAIIPPKQEEKLISPPIVNCDVSVVSDEKEKDLPYENNDVSVKGISIGQANIITKILNKITDEIEQIKKILPRDSVEVSEKVSVAPDIDVKENMQGDIVEGAFDGEGMVGSDGKHYDVPVNYASKSKLVEGDILKLTITPDGSFLFKQIGPSERDRLIGTLAYDPSKGRYIVVTDDKKYYILTASVTYFKGKPGDESVILIPKNTPSRWAAVENIINKIEMNKN